jgi:plastocyanin domain-containing protein
MKATAFLIIALGVLAGGCDAASNDAAASAKSQSNKPRKSRAVDVVVGDDGFQPNRVEALKDELLTLRFKRTSEETCATDVVFPELALKKALPLGQTVTVEIPTESARTLVFQCGMGMYKSSVVITGS